MIVFMLRDPATNLYYRRSTRFGHPWVTMEQASIWTTRAGPVAAKARVANDQYRYRGWEVHPNPMIVELDLTERTD